MLELSLNAFITLFVVIDPVGVATLFAALTFTETAAYRRKMALKGTLISATILLSFTLSGDWLLSTLGIGLPAFRIAGGVLLFFLAIDMVLARDSGLRSTTLRENEEAVAKQDISVFPLAIPLIAGPGALTSMLLLTGSGADKLSATLLVVGMMLVVLLLTLGALLFAGRMMKIIGVTGSGVVSRVLGILLAALAVQFVLDGVHASFP
ncbi:MarC family protein [soil metagenome]